MASQRRSSLADLLVAAGVLVSIIVAVLSTLLADLSASILLCVGLIGIAVALQVDLILRLTQRTRTDALNLRVLGQILSAGALADPLAVLAQSIAEFSGHMQTPIAPLAHGELESSLRELRRLQSGQVILPDGDTALMIEQLLRVTRTIHATTFTNVDYEWWTCPGGRTYLEANARAIERGASIERVLVYKEWDERAAQLASEQVARGICVYRVDHGLLDPELQRNFVVYDKSFLVEDEVSLDGGVTGCMHSVDEVIVAGALDAFRRIRTKAQAVTS
jgi:hypothetical protein